MKRIDLKVGAHIAYRPYKRGMESEVVILSTEAWDKKRFYYRQAVTEPTILAAIVDGEAKAFDVSAFERDDRKRTALVAYVESGRAEVAQLSHLIGDWEKVREDRRQADEERQAWRVKEQSEHERLQVLAAEIGERLGVHFFMGNYGWNNIQIGTDELAKALDRFEQKAAAS